MNVFYDFPVSEALWYRVGGKVKYFLTAESREDVLQALDFVEKKHPERFFVCGMGANIIFPDEYFDGAVLQIFKKENGMESVRRTGVGELEAFAGAKLDDVIKRAFEEKMTGLEWAGGLPGTTGGGVRGNVGAFGGEIKDNISEIEALEIKKDGFDTRKIKHDELHFSYRNSLVKEKKGLIILSALFNLTPSGEKEVREKKAIYEKNIDYRNTHHPMDLRSCGSVFKNISDKKEVEKVIAEWPEVRELVEGRWHGKVSMGYIIKKLGLNEYRVGNMQISPKHSNFIVNLGGAKALDALTVISSVQEKVNETFGFRPEVEVEIVKNERVSSKF